MWFFGNLSLMVGLFDGLSTMLPNWSAPLEAMPKDSPFYDKIFEIEPYSLQERMEMAKLGKFSDNFLFGAATSAYQVEGAWNESDKGISIWDHVTHTHPEAIKDGSNGDVATDFYHKYKTDIGLVKQLGANSFKISLSWTRILPNGFDNYVSQDGIKFYNNVINEMISQGITPMVTIYHWDLPQKLQELGGWANPMIADWLVDFARVAFKNFGDRVKLWSTLNEPLLFCIQGYGSDVYAPRLKQGGIADYLCGHHTLLAHAKVYRMYQEEFEAEQKGKVGIIAATIYPVVKQPDDPESVLGAERFYTFMVDWLLHPIFSATGDYPETMKNRVKAKSTAQGFTRSRMPEFSKEEIDLVRGTADFLGINFYQGFPVEKYISAENEISFYDDIGMTWSYLFDDRKFEEKSTPKMFKELIVRIDTDYKIPILIITENGYDDNGEHLDSDRSKYFYQHLSELPPLIASGINIQGYYAWSFVDNFEWNMGYTVYYGIHSVNYSDPGLTRSPKMSTKILSDVYKTKKIPEFASSVNEIDFQVPLSPQRRSLASFFENLF